MSRVYESLADLRMRLNGTVVLHKGDPVFVSVEDSTNWETVYLASLTSGKNYRVSYKELDTSSPQLGYMNWKDNAYYVERISGRWQFQGLRQEGLTIRDLGRNAIGNYLTSKSFASCILADHPTLKSALDDVLNFRAIKRAFHRDLAVGRGAQGRINLYYKDTVIGNRVHDADKFSLIHSKGSSFIHNLLIEEKLVEIA